MCGAFLFVKCGIFIAVCLANFETGDPFQFIAVPKNITATVGHDILIEWEYNATDRNETFTSYSPEWYFKNTSGHTFQLAREVWSNNWTWEISTNVIPKRLLYPVQRIHKYNGRSQGQFSASLNITNCSLADSGMYECQLNPKFDNKIKSSMYLTVEGTTPTPTTTTTTTPTTTPVTTPFPKRAIIATAVVVPIVVIVVFILVCWYCHKKKGNRVEENISLEEGSPYRPVNGKENPGLSESQTPYARSGPKSDHNGQPTNNNPDTGDGTATYAAVDMSKKKDKSKTKDPDV